VKLRVLRGKFLLIFVQNKEVVFMKLNFRTIGKIGFLVVIIGFFMPLACDGNGFQIASSEHVDTSFSLLLYGLFISAFAGIFIGVLLLMNKKVSVFFDWLIMLICMCCGLIPFFGTIKEYGEYYQTGVHVIITGLAVLLIAQIASAILENQKESLGEKSLNKYFLFFLGPTLIAFSIAFVVPFIMGVVLSFTRFTTMDDVSWVGFNNYIRAFSNPDFLNALGFTTLFTVVSVIIINVAAFALALLLTQGYRGTNVFRTMIFMPNLIGGIVLGYIWLFIINNGFLTPLFGVTITVNPQYGFWGMVVLSNWQFIGYMMIIFIAGIQTIPNDVLEAAKIDGADKVTVLGKIVIPMVMPSITITLFMTLTNSFKMFDQNLALTAGEPGKRTVMLALDIYNTAFNRAGWEGVGQAKALMFFAIVVIIALVQLSITRRKEVEG
jgi:raffinose/stachyose/melibiose transport system permease protein